MAETTKRSDVEITIVWNPDTGALDLKFDGAQALHVIGILSFAAHVLASKQLPETGQPERIIFPHLVRQ